MFPITANTRLTSQPCVFLFLFIPTTLSHVLYTLPKIYWHDYNVVAGKRAKLQLRYYCRVGIRGSHMRFVVFTEVKYMFQCTHILHQAGHEVCNITLTDTENGMCKFINHEHKLCYMNFTVGTLIYRRIPTSITFPEFYVHCRLYSYVLADIFMGECTLYSHSRDIVS